MPSGRTHDRITILCLPLVAAGALVSTGSSYLTLWVLSGFLLGGLMLGPDLDIHSVQYKRWGWLRWIWLPYRSRLKHRSLWSHGPVVGTVVRVLYLLLWLLVLGVAAIALANQLGEFGWTWADLGLLTQRSLQQWLIELLALGVGLEVGAMSHYGADWLTSTYKKITRPPRKTSRSSKATPRRRSKAKKR
ncbi:MAG: metal-binding protein [Synechococcales cyanobacterium K44_A2020_017]|nr:metal-binding protein [Synechococcales cyanobacterium K32_A2020_035]MBF2095928.1 metal-binding protein [Synechococcales cyanobacterium K44_A2020_017]